MKRFPTKRMLVPLAAVLAAACATVPVLAMTGVAHWATDSLGLTEPALELVPPDARGLPHVAHRIAVSDRLRIVAFGSSSTAGVGASSPSHAYPAEMEVVLRTALPRMSGGVTVINSGIGGETVNEMAKRVEKDVVSQHPDLVIFQLGSNDLLRKVPIDHFRTLTVALVDRMRRAGIDVMLMEPQWCPKLEARPDVNVFRDAIREIGTQTGVPVIRRSDMMREWVADSKVTMADMLAPDGLHMADKGYALLAKSAAFEILQKSLPLESED